MSVAVKQPDRVDKERLTLGDREWGRRFLLGQELESLFTKDEIQARHFATWHYRELLESGKRFAEKRFPELFIFEEEEFDKTLGQGGLGGSATPTTGCDN